MSGGGFKELLYKLPKQDSRNAAWLGNALGIQKLEDEGKYNVKNPGHAVSTAGEYAIGSYLGGLLGGALGNAGTASTELAIPAAEAAIQGGTTTAIDVASEQAIRQALEEAAKQVPVTELSSNLTPVKDLSSQAGLLDKARLALTSGSGQGKGAQQLAMQLGMKSLEPQQQPQPMPAPPRQQAPQEPLPMPYQSPYGPNGNSMGLLSLEEIRRRKAMGLLR